MASSSLPCHLLVLAVVVLTVRCTTAITVDEACRKYTKHPSYCAHALSPKTGPGPLATPTTLPALAEQAVLLAAKSGGATVSFVKNLEKIPGGMPLGCLEKCVGKFQAAVAALTRSRAAIVEHKDVARVKAWVKVARADGDTCLDGCHTMEGAADPTIIRRVGDLGKLCSIALALTDAAAHNSD